jgi:general nucleoside transport system permease protein
MTGRAALDFAVNLLAAGVARGTPILFATLGELFTERAGVLNLGVEGMMLLGAMSGYGVARASGSAWLGLCAAMLAAGALSLLHALVTVGLRADQVVSGLGLTFVGTGLSAVLGAPLCDSKVAVARLPELRIPLLDRIPVLGPILFAQNVVVALGFVAVPLAWWFLYRTRPGLHLRAVGEHPAAADSLGISVGATRTTYVAVGGLLAGLAGASLSLGITPGWVEGMTAGQGWVAVGLVIFGGWDPVRAAIGAWLFGAIRRLPLDLQGVQDLPLFRNPNLGYFLNMLPYLFTIAVLVVGSREAFRRRIGAPAALGLPFVRGQR